MSNSTNAFRRVIKGVLILLLTVNCLAGVFFLLCALTVRPGIVGSQLITSVNYTALAFIAIGAFANAVCAYATIKRRNWSIYAAFAGLFFLWFYPKVWEGVLISTLPSLLSTFILLAIVHVPSRPVWYNTALKLTAYLGICVMILSCVKIELRSSSYGLISFGLALGATALMIKIQESSRLRDLGLAWNRYSFLNFSLGIGGAIIAAILILIVQLVTSKTAPDAFAYEANFLIEGLALFVVTTIVTSILLYGYGFQLLISSIGKLPTILILGVISVPFQALSLAVFSIAYLPMLSIGILLGYAFCRSGDLWFLLGLNMIGPIGFVLRTVTKVPIGGIAIPWLELGILILIVWKAPVHRQVPSFIAKRKEESDREA